MDTSELLQHIKSRVGLSEEEILARVAQKQHAMEGLLSKDGALHIVANELGINAKELYSKRVSLEKLVPGMRYSEVVGKVIRLFPVRQYEKNGKQGSVGSFVLQGATCSRRVVLWDEQSKVLETLQQGDTVTIENPRVQLNKQGEVEVHFTHYTRFATAEVMRKPLSVITEQDSTLCVYGTVVAMQDIRYFEQCPTCRRRMVQQGEQWLCGFHDVQTPYYGYMLPLVLDDGTETMRVILFSKQVEQLLGINDSQIQGFRENATHLTQLRKQLIGRDIMVTGNVQKNKFFSGLELNATQVHFPTPDQVVKHLERFA